MSADDIGSTMQTYTNRKVIKCSPRYSCIEAKNTQTNQVVNIVEFRCRDSATLRRYQAEVDIQRGLESHFAMKVKEVGLSWDESHQWLVQVVREFCKMNLAAEIRRRKDRGQPWTDDALFTLTKQLVEVLTEVQSRGACIAKLTLKALLVRADGTVILGAFNRAAYTADIQKTYAIVKKLAVILCLMVALRSDEESARDLDCFVSQVDFAMYPKIEAVVAQVRNPQREMDFLDFQQLLNSIEAPLAADLRVQTSVPAEPQKNSEYQLPPVRPVAQTPPKPQAVPHYCATCGKSFTVANFNLATLRPEYRRYPAYLDKVCSLQCLDIYIKYTQTQAQPLQQCMVCGTQFYPDYGAAEGGNPLDLLVCSEHCRLSAASWKG